MSFEDQDLGDAWECPTCLQPFPPHHDYECGTCEAKASEHLRVTTMCKLLRETQRRENSLIVQLSDAKTSVEHWQAKAKQADEAANDLVAELIDTRREWKEEIAAVQARLLDPHAVYINMLHGKIAKLDWEKLEHIHGNHPAREQLAAERALADRLAGALKELLYYDLRDVNFGRLKSSRDALTAWKEARSE